MDTTFKTEDGIFNYRVAALLIHDEKILILKDHRTEHYYLPGGRVDLHEASSDAVLRELREELGLDEARVERPLWLNEGFYVRDRSGERVHELCLYFLIDFSKTDLLTRGESFEQEEHGKVHECKWVSFDALEDEHFYPLFLKKRICSLPESMEMMVETK